MGLLFNKIKILLNRAEGNDNIFEIVRYMRRHVWDLRSELRHVLLEELKIQPDVFQRCPRFCLYGVGVQVIDPRTLHGQQKR